MREAVSAGRPFDSAHHRKAATTEAFESISVPSRSDKIGKGGSFNVVYLLLSSNAGSERRR